MDACSLCASAIQPGNEGDKSYSQSSRPESGVTKVSADFCESDKKLICKSCLKDVGQSVSKDKPKQMKRKMAVENLQEGKKIKLEDVKNQMDEFSFNLMETDSVEIIGEGDEMDVGEWKMDTGCVENLPQPVAVSTSDADYHSRSGSPQSWSSDQCPLILETDDEEETEAVPSTSRNLGGSNGGWRKKL